MYITVIMLLFNMLSWNNWLNTCICTHILYIHYNCSCFSHLPMFFSLAFGDLTFRLNLQFKILSSYQKYFSLQSLKSPASTKCAKTPGSRAEIRGARVVFYHHIWRVDVMLVLMNRTGSVLYVG